MSLSIKPPSEKGTKPHHAGHLKNVRLAKTTCNMWNMLQGSISRTFWWISPHNDACEVRGTDTFTNAWRGLCKHITPCVIIGWHMLNWTAIWDPYLNVNIPLKPCSTKDLYINRKIYKKNGFVLPLPSVIVSKSNIDKEKLLILKLNIK